MAEVIGVRFKNTGKVYYFDPNGVTLDKGDRAIVETARGVECGEVAMENRDVPEDSIVQPLRKVVRKATKEDLQKVEENHKKEKSAFKACERRIAARGLEMKLVDVEYTFDNSKILFYFTADGRVDFRELVKDLAGMFRTRIELRQIGVRDEAKMLGGIGICGQGAGPVPEPGEDLRHLRPADVLPEVRAGGLPGPAAQHPQGGGAGVHRRGQGHRHRAEPLDPQAHRAAGKGPRGRAQGLSGKRREGAAGRQDEGGQEGAGTAEKPGGEISAAKMRGLCAFSLAFFIKCGRIGLKI